MSGNEHTVPTMNALHAAAQKKRQQSASPAYATPEDGFTRRYFGMDNMSGQPCWSNSKEARAKVAHEPFWYVDVKEDA